MSLQQPCVEPVLNQKCQSAGCSKHVWNYEEVVSFFNMAFKRSFKLKQVLGGGGSLLTLCETRWVERHNTILHFQDGFLPIVEALSIISAWEDTTS